MPSARLRKKGDKPLIFDQLIVKLALIGVLGIGAQWLAWRAGKPAIALMLAAGIVAGPVLHLLDPERDLGPLREPVVKLAVAVILFEGGLSLNLRELRLAGRAVGRLIVIGVPVGWALGAAAAYWGAGLSRGVSALFAGILVVTGPTVIGPLLRTLRVPPRVRDTLKWEGIINDPIGALLAIAIFSYLSYAGPDRGVGGILLTVGGATLAAAAIGGALGWAITAAFPRGYVPEYLKAPVVLVTVIAGYVAANLVLGETGLITVTVMGAVIANRPNQSTAALRHFKEDLAVLLISGVFIILSATLDWSVIERFQLRFVLFLALLLLVVRPVTVLVSLAFSDVPWRERLFIGWVAPRGVVAIAVTGLFAIRLKDIGAPDADALVPLVFGVVVATILAHGFSAPWVARRFGLLQGEGDRVLLVGANEFTVALGEALEAAEVGVTVADTGKFALRTASKRGLATYRGDVLDEITQQSLDLAQFQQVVVATDNDAYNSLVCADLRPELGSERLAQTAPELGQARGRTLFENPRSVEDLSDRVTAGWAFARTRLSEVYGWAEYQARIEDGAEPLAVLRGTAVTLFSAELTSSAGPGDVILALVPPELPAAPRNPAPNLPG